MKTSPFVIPLYKANDITLVGGKAINLYELITAGFSVPKGFVVTTEAFHRAGQSHRIPKDVSEQIKSAFNDLGQPTVAVRSSATAEDLPSASMAGQYDTFLDVTGIKKVLYAVERCWRSLANERVETYLREHGINSKNVAMAVVVQELIPAEVSGVLFTANPHTGAEDEMVVEAVYGLGEGMVSGELQPDVFHFDANSENVLNVKIANKKKALRQNQDGYQAVPEEKATKACLNYTQIQDLRKLGLKVQRHFGQAQDVEWALANGQLHILQARVITTLDETRIYHQLLNETRAFLQAELSQEHGPWVRHNLGETLPHPTPLTWSLIRSFMSGAGGFGHMYRKVGYSPSAKVEKNGFLILIAGRIYMDCGLLPKMFSQDYPYTYDLERLRSDPNAAQQPPTIPRGKFKQLVSAARLGNRAAHRIRYLAETLDTQFDQEFVPQVAKWCADQARQDLTSLSDTELTALWQTQQDRVLNDFGATAFLPSMVEALVTADLRAFLIEHIWDHNPETILQKLSVSTIMDATLRSNIELQEVAYHKRSIEKWLQDNGFHGPGEFDLFSPRWSERPDFVEKLVGQLADAPDLTTRHNHRRAEADRCLDDLKSQLSKTLAQQLDKHVTLLQRYLRFREDGKAVLMRAFAQLRRTALEFGRRLNLQDNIFFLSHEELVDSLHYGFVHQDQIHKRRLEHRIAQRIILPPVIEMSDLATLGESELSHTEDKYQAYALALGTGKGPAHIVLDPIQAGDLGDNYILICPSTDPAWTPLFLKAAGLILEQGGILSHGAIVAREMGLPAVVLENATTLFEEGELLTVDGNKGFIVRNNNISDRDIEISDPEDAHIDFIERPPVIGHKERRANRNGLIAASAWGILLVAMYLLPASWLKEPTFDLIDVMLWPSVRTFGMSWTVAFVGVFFAILPLIIQCYTSDNSRLWEAKRRATHLQKIAKDFRPGSPRRKAMLVYAASVTPRILKASMAALAWVLGPMILTILWMPQRLDPAVWNADPGGLVTVTADVDGEYQGPVTCFVTDPLVLEDTTPSTQTLPPIRATLENLRSEWQQNSDLGDYPWQLQKVGEQAQAFLLASLNAYLATGVPPQKLTWMIRVPENAVGHYPINFIIDGQTTEELILAFGNQKPPTQKKVNSYHNPLIRVEAFYPRPLKQRYFWTPLVAIGGPAWDFGWLGVYILSYLFVMLIFKRILHIP